MINTKTLNLNTKADILEAERLISIGWKLSGNKLHLFTFEGVKPSKIIKNAAK